MPPEVSVVIPVERDAEWDKDRATNLPVGTPLRIVEYDEPGEWAEALNAGVGACDTPYVLLSGPDVWHDTETLDLLGDLAWDADVTYGRMIQKGPPDRVVGEAMFCPNRLRLENYLPSTAVVRRDKFPGVTTGLWDLWCRMSDNGRVKYVPEALSARDGVYDDPSPQPEPPAVKATFYYQATPGTAYWRSLLPARHLPGQAIFAGPSVAADKDGKMMLPQQHGDTVVWQYAGCLQNRLMMKHMREKLGLRVLVEVDDNYTRWFPDQMRKAGWHETIAAAGDTGFSVEQHVALLSEADGVTVTTPYLAKQYRPYNPNVYVCPNQIDPDDWPDPVKPGDGVFRIGWFASASHRGDGKLIVRALEWASRQPDVEVTLMGVGVTGAKPWYPFRFRHVPWSNDLGVYRRYLGELDVGLAPIVGTPWAVCRSDLKALEYAMAGALPIVSDLPPYEGCEVPGIVHCPDEKAFLRAVQWAVANQDEARQLAAEARDYVLAERTVQHNISNWSEACKN